MKLRVIFEKYRHASQLVYGLVLIVVIPTLIAINTVWIINRYSGSMDLALQQHALSVGRSIATLIKADLPWDYFVQYKINELKKNNIGLEEIMVLEPADSGFKIVASTKEEALGVVSRSPIFIGAWKEKPFSGLATDSINLCDIYKGKIGDIEAAKRAWLVVMPMSDDENNKSALLALELSAEKVDELKDSARRTALLILAATLVLVIMFLSVIVRLWDYAVLYKKAKEIESLKDEFVSMASHELRSPITGITGYTQMLVSGEMGPVPDKVKEGLQMILGAGERLANLVDDLLDVGRIEQGRIIMNPRAVDPDKIIEETVKMFRVQARQKGLALGYHPHRQPLPRIKVDPDRFKQIMTNLLSNAIKYTLEGEVQVITKTRYNNRVLEITVRDTGIGMSDEEKKNLFAKFYRALNDKAGHVNGTGLGLWITKRLAEMMYGTIEVESIEDVGTRIGVQFPIIGE